MHLSDLSEADMSRRLFLKVGGQAAMAAAAPKSALKGLVGKAAPGASTAAIIPKTPKAMKAALLKWIQDNKLEQYWRNLARKEDSANYNEAEFMKDMADR